jgi:hypothetical protein
MFQIRTDKTEGFGGISLFDLIDSLNGFLVQDIASDTIISIGGIGDNTTVSEDVHHFGDQPLLRIDGIDIDQHGYHFD